MASWWTVVLILQIGAFCEYTHATTCTASTKNTCAPTLQVTGTCTSSVCDCMSGFVPTRTGCRGTVTPILYIVTKIAGVEFPGNGEVLEGGLFTLRCYPDYGNGQYVWKKGSTIMSNKDREYIVAMATASDAGTYSCKIKFTTDDFETAESTPMTVTVVANSAGQKFTKVPTVVGMPAKAYAGVTIVLACSNLPSGQTLTFEWYKGTTLQSGNSQTFTTTAGTDQYSCKMVKVAGTIADFETPESAKVNPPTVVTTISGVFVSSVNPKTPEFINGPRPDVPPVVYAETGNTLTIYCAINDTDVAFGTPTYVWKKDGNAVGTATVSFSKVVTSADSGSYTCTATVGTPGTPYTSRPVQLNVQTTVIESVDLVAKPVSAIIGGYVYLDCQVKTADLSRVTYIWKKNIIALPNVTDRALQINDLASSDATNYTCTATVGLDSSSDTASFKASTLTSITPTLGFEDIVFGVGDKHTLMCGDDYNTPGLTYKWYEGGVQVSGQTSWNYEITVKAGTTKYTCDITLGSATSQTSIERTIVGKQFVDVDIDVGEVELDPLDPYQPLSGTSVTMTCDDTLASGATGTPTYAWTKDGTATGSATSTLTFTAGASNDGEYKCTATLGEETLSATVTVKHSDTLTKPELFSSADVFDGDIISYSEGADYEFSCHTDSYSPDLLFVWKKGTVIVGSGRIYKIKDADRTATTGDSGDYVCITMLGDKTATSDTLTVLIGAKGRPCKYISDCKGDYYSDECLENRCVCVAGYILNGNSCSATADNGQEIVSISMYLLLLCGVIRLIL